MTESNFKKVIAVLGPTNTGKTHYAIDRMLAHKSGLIGFPLRLLAKEVYEKICRIKGVSSVALITGEEKILPKNPSFYICTVEAMPMKQSFDFVAIDEIQLCGDPDRGYIFTDRLLNLRGEKETLLLGSDIIKERLKNLCRDVEFIYRTRLSELKYSGSKKISRLPPRSAIIGFSIESVYSIAEFVQRQKGGAAVVLGALSPRTRNAQVELYENGEVDYLVATDAIGMGLNLDIKHIAFSSIKKFDGRSFRNLFPNEIAQIAGRAGRNQVNGSFGVTGELGDLDSRLINLLENHNFLPIKKLNWRNSNLDFSSVLHLIKALEQEPPNSDLTKAREADDIIALKSLWGFRQVTEKVLHSSDVQLLWNVCKIPDYRKISPSDHSMLLMQIFEFLSNSCRIPDDWLHSHVLRLNKLDGDIDVLSKRLSFIRTWRYVANRKNWIDDPVYWQGYTREIEDKLSDALHEKLKQRFIDKRTSILMKGLRQRETLVAEIREDNAVFIDEQFVGKLNGFIFELDKSIPLEQKKTFASAASSALSDKLQLLAEKLYRGNDTEIDVSDQGEFIWRDSIIGTCEKGSDIFKPEIVPFVSDFVPEGVREQIKRRLDHFLKRKIDNLFEPLFNVQNDEAIIGVSRGLSFRLYESLGVIPRSVVMDDVKKITQEERALLRKHGIRFGQFTIFFPALVKPGPTKLRLILWGKFFGLSTIPPAPGPGLVSIELTGSEPKGYFPRAGLRAAGDRAIRIDMLERVADLIREEDGEAGFEATADMLSLTGMSHEQFSNLMGGLNYKVTESERVKKKSELKATNEQASGFNEEEEIREKVYTFSYQKKSEKTSDKENSNRKRKQTHLGRKNNKKELTGRKNYVGKNNRVKRDNNFKIDPDNPFSALLALKEK